MNHELKPGRYLSVRVLKGRPEIGRLAFWNRRTKEPTVTTQGNGLSNVAGIFALKLGKDRDGTMMYLILVKGEILVEVRA